MRRRDHDCFSPGASERLVRLRCYDRRSCNSGVTTAIVDSPVLPAKRERSPIANRRTTAVGVAVAVGLPASHPSMGARRLPTEVTEVLAAVGGLMARTSPPVLSSHSIFAGSVSCTASSHCNVTRRRWA